MQKKGDFKKELILEAAYKCISEKGYANVSLRDIANESCVVLSQLNYYFENKEGLFSEVVKYYSIIHLERMKVRLSQFKGNGMKIDNIVDFFSDTLKENPGVFKILIDLASMSLWSERFKMQMYDLLNDMANVVECYLFDKNDLMSNKINIENSTQSQLILSTILGVIMQSKFSIDANNQFEMLKHLGSNFEGLK